MTTIPPPLTATQHLHLVAEHRWQYAKAQTARDEALDQLRHQIQVAHASDTGIRVSELIIVSGLARQTVYNTLHTTQEHTS